MSRNDYYTTGYLLDFLCHQNFYKLIGIDLLRQSNTNNSGEINFTGKLGEDGWCNNVFYFWKAGKNNLH